MAGRPNIVWLLTDHHVFAHHWRQNGPRPALPTYERLSHEGIHFENAQSICPLCTPARASMLTGAYPHRHGMVMNNGDCGSRLDFEPDERLFSHYLLEAGYRVGYFGKWHCGEERKAGDYGFEGFSMLGYGHAYWSDEYAEYLDALGLPQAEVDVEWKFGDPSWRGRRVLLKDEPNTGRLMESCGTLTTPVETHEAFFVAHLACRWLEQAAQTGEPFCLRVDVWGPHQPYFVGAPFAGSIDPTTISEYVSFRATLDSRPEFHRAFRDLRHNRAAIQSWEEWQPIVARSYEHATQVDTAIGRVLAVLDRIGLAENTIVFYTADHGDAIASNGGVFDKDSLMVEETMRIPLAVRWPGRVPAGVTSEKLVTHMDIVPTVLEAAGTESIPLAVRWPGRVPAGVTSEKLVTHMDIVPTVLEAAGAESPAPMDGESMLELIQHPSTAAWREDLMCQHHGHGSLHFQRLLRRGNHKYVAHLDDQDELYDLERDPYELTNLVDRPDMQGILSEMRERLCRQMAAYDDAAPDADKLRHQIS
jgi:arylsulfatase A-like enzyme